MKKKEKALLISSITKEILIELFINNNLTINKIAEKYDISTASISRLLKKYGIQKPKELRLMAISNTKQNKTEEEKAIYSQHISAARKGKGLGQIPWNKGTKGLQVAWNKGKRIPGRPRTAESLEKARQTCLARYGVTWACQRPEARLKGQESAANIAFEERLKNNNIKYTREFPIAGYSYDFKIENYLIEINPYATHNSTWGIRANPPKKSDYHLLKSKAAIENNYFCIHCFDWDDQDKLIKLLQPKTKISARECKIKEISKKDAQEFINSIHLQNYALDKIRLGLYYKDSLVSVMTFGKPRYNKNFDYELIRYCSSARVIGGSKKLFKFFINNYSPKSIVSYCDEAKFSGNTYINLGFNKAKNSKPSKHWYNPKTKQHFTDNLLRQRGADQLIGTNYGKGTSNEELMRQHGFVEIFDCGQATYVWKKED